LPYTSLTTGRKRLPSASGSKPVTVKHARAPSCSPKAAKTCVFPAPAGSRFFLLASLAKNTTRSAPTGCAPCTR
jgi:hypothetical protein